MPGASAKIDARHLQKSLKALIQQVPLDEPWKAKGAEELDRISYQEWLNRTVSSPLVKANAAMLSRANFCAEPYEVSLLWALYDMKSGGGMDEMNGCGCGTQEMTFVSGAQQLPNAMMRQLKGKVLLKQPVHEVKSEGGSVTVVTYNGEQYQAEHVILAISPCAQMRITFQPELPALRNQLLARMPMGSLIKTMIYYRKPFWREKGLSGLLTVEDDDVSHPVMTCMDNTKPDNTFPCLIGFIAGKKARILSSLSKDERRRLIAAQYATMFGCPQLNEPVHYEEKDWSADIWAGGGYAGIMGPGVLTEFGRILRASVGRLHFAGTETAMVWPGYMEGAIEAGQRVAREVLLAMGKDISELRDPYIDQELKQDSDNSSMLDRCLPSRPSIVKSVTALGLLAAITATGKYIIKPRL
jgi:monoamine oxidase